MIDKPKILIIDDEEIVIDSCTQILKGGNYQIATANNGTDGLELMKEYQPDLVYVDLKMPGLSGFEVLDLIHEYDPTIVTIVITGFDFEPLRISATTNLPACPWTPFTVSKIAIVKSSSLK